MQRLYLLTLLFCQCTVGYKILCIFPMPSRSHGYLAKGIVDPLLKAGHQVTWVSPYTDWEPHPNLTLIGVPETLDYIAEIKKNRTKLNARKILATRQRMKTFLQYLTIFEDTNLESSLEEVKKFAMEVSDRTIGNKHVRELLVKEQFDAVVTEWFESDYDAGYAAIQQAPWIMLSGIAMHCQLEFLLDEVRSVSTMPFILVDAGVPMNFKERARNALYYLYMTLSRFLEKPSNIKKYEKDFLPLAEARGMSLPPYDEAIHNTSILFVNSHLSIGHAIVLPPNVVDIGGYHIQDEVAPLPEDLQPLLDNSSPGVIYFSMGTVFGAKNIPMRTLQVWLSWFSELNHTVLWKFEEKFKELPSNVHTRAWFPQASILAHPKTVLFLTQCGSLSLFEAVKHGVPMLALPAFWDQPANAANAVRLGIARSVRWNPRVIPDLKTEINEILYNRSYYNRAKEVSRLFNKRPIPPSKLITHYIELAIETKGAYHLRSVSRLYPWWARWMIDQLLAVALLAGILVYAARRLLAFILATFSTKEVKKKMKKA